MRPRESRQNLWQHCWGAVLGAGFLALMSGGFPAVAGAGQVVTLRSEPLAVYGEVLNEFKYVYGRLASPGAWKRVASVQYSDFLLNELGEGGIGQIMSTRPELIVAIGQLALERVQDVSGVPIVHLMTVRVPEGLAGRSDVRGVSLEVSPEQWVDAFVRVLPDKRRVGIAYDPRRTGAWVERAVLYGRLHRLYVTAVSVASDLDVPGALGTLRGAVDAIWMLPDLTAVTPRSVEQLAEFSMQEGVPVFSFAEKYLEKGATAALVLSPAEVARQGAELAAGLISGSTRGMVSTSSPQVVMRVNRSLAARFLPDASIPDG